MEDIFEEFKTRLANNGFSTEILWLHEKQIHNTEDMLYIYPMNGYASEEQVKAVFTKYKHRFDCGATLMLVAEDRGLSYCTLLMDSFGSDTDIEIEPNIYFWLDEPYVDHVCLVKNTIKWFLTKRKNNKLSSLDYAFQIQQAYT